MLVLDSKIGRTLGYRQLRNYPKFHQVWIELYANEIGRICKGIGTSPDASGKRVEGTTTFLVINYDVIPANRCKEITYTKVVCKVRPEKVDPNCTCITIEGSHI